MKVGEMMNTGVRTCRASDSLETAAYLMWEHDCGALPVVNDVGRVVGMITDRDVCMGAYTQGKALRDVSVGTSMSKQAITVHVFETIAVAEQRMREAHVRRLPVLDSEQKLVGILSLSDLAREAYRERDFARSQVPAVEIAETLALICEPRGTATTDATAA